MKIITNCPLCSGINLKEFYSGVDRYFSGKKIKASSCMDCSLVFLNPMPSKEEYKEWYMSVFQDKRRNISTKEEAIKRILAKGNYKNKLEEAKRLSQLIPQGKNRCLEIGCGWGTLAYAFKKEFGVSIKAIELSRLACEVARDYYHLDVFEGDFDKFFESCAGEKYDLIFMYHVFEHLLNPDDFLKKVSTLLTKGGVLFLALPDATNPGEPSDKFFHYEHCFYYTPKTLSLVLEKNKFKPIKINQDYQDMKVTCIVDKDGFEPVYNNNELKKIRKALLVVDGKYAILRLMKKIVFFVFGAVILKKISSFVARLLRRFRIIKV